MRNQNPKTIDLPTGNKKNRIEYFYNQSLKVIENNSLLFIEDVVAYLGISRTTFYDYFPLNSDRMNTIKTMLESNKVSMKVALREKMFRSKNSTLNLALYKLICSDDERKLLSMKYVDVSVTDNEQISNQINIENLTEEEQLIILKAESILNRVG